MVARDTEDYRVLDDMVSVKDGLEMLRPTTQNGGFVCKKHLPICTAEGTLNPVKRAIHCHEGFVEVSVVT